jgi:tetratricopeptide (TPR) repeat protein
MVRDGLGDETGAKAIEERGIDFVPTEEFLQSLKAAGANEAFLQVLRGARHPQPAGEAAKKALNQVQVSALLAGQVPSRRVAVLVDERGIDFEPTNEYLEEVRLGGGEDELIKALKSANVTKPEHVDRAFAAREGETLQHLVRGGEYMFAGRFDDAEGEFAAAVRLEPEEPGLHLVLGEALESEGNLNGAVAEFRQAVRLNPNNETSHLKLAWVLGLRGDGEGAIGEYSEALHLNPKNDLAYYNRGVNLMGMGKEKRDAAIADLREAIRLNPSNHRAHFLLGLALEGEGDREGALQQYRAACRLDPQNSLYSEAYERLLLPTGH